MRTIRIGSGAGYGGDRIEPAIDLIRRGDLDYIIFECLAERTVSIAQTRRRQNPELGYNDLFDYRFTRILDALVDLRAETKRAPRIVTNMGAANPTAAAKRCLAMARERNLTGLKIACVTGDDKTDELDRYLGMTTIETGAPLSDIDGEVLSANGYIGCSGIVEALDRGADIVITGRVADPRSRSAPGARIRLEHGRLHSSWAGTWSVTCSNAPVRSAAGTSPIPATRKCPTCGTSASPSSRSMRRATA